ncbi:MFS general substrate transporter [Obba rivulosa]|uniref:MFS general substrate transporter n=1 Tax=Obba rivulosa TaxID=1052685 RepID=A0A8E2DT80_9APHY|nr:MFS general substrate transporter [Obba rivulosa]
MSRHDEYADEETALLSQPQDKKLERPTPLPVSQLSILMLLQLAEPITSHCIYPFINQLISELDITGGDERKVGYYAGLIQSVFFATEALFVLQWSQVSDYIGRKPVLLTGVGGLCISMLFFGLSKTFLGLVISRCIVGVMNGNMGVIKSMIGELTDSTNMAQGFALMPVVWSVGVTIGPFIGGQLAKPHDRWPDLFKNDFWIKYPYFLPCAASSAFSALTFIIVAVFLKETVERKKKKAPISPVGETPSDPSQIADDADKPASLRSLMVRPVLLSVANYGALALLDIAYLALLPLFLAMPIEFGGLGMTPATIGTILGAFGLMNGTFQAFFFAKFMRWWGPKRVFMVGMASFIPLFAFPPIINMVARRDGVTPLVYTLISIQLFISIIMDMSFGCIFMFITSSAPNKRSLGATNGIAQLAASIIRAIGPAAATSLFSLSVEHNWLGGYAVYGIFIVISTLLVLLAVPLPREAWEKRDRA